MNRPKKIQSVVSWLCVPLLLIAVCGAGALTGSYLRVPDRLVHLPRPDAGDPVLSVPLDMLDFGEAWVQPAFVWTLPVTNSSDHPVEVSRIVTTCSCTSVEPEAFVVEAGGTVPVQLTLDLADEYELDVVAIPTSPGTVDCDLQVHVMAADGSPLPAYSIPVSGQVVRDVQPIRNNVTLGVLTAGSRFQSRVELRSLTDSEFEVPTATCSDDGVQVEAEHGSSTVFNVSGVANGLGMQSSDIHFTIRHADGVSYLISVPLRYVATEES